MSEKPAKPKVLFGTPSAATPRSNEPKILAGGVRRQRIPCSVPQLQAMFPEADGATLAHALQCVNSINLDDSHLDDVARFGAELQDEHQAIAVLRRTIAEHESVRHAKAILADVTALFEQLDPDRLFTTNAPPVWHVWRRWVSPARTALSVYRQAHARITQRMNDLAAHEHALMDASESMGRLAERCAALAEKMTCCVLAAKFIVDTCTRDAISEGSRSHYASQIDLLGQRAASLASSHAMLQADRIANDISKRELHALAAGGSGLREAMLPGFDAAFATALASPNPLNSALFVLSGHYHRTLKFLKESNP